MIDEKCPSTTIQRRRPAFSEFIVQFNETVLVQFCFSTRQDTSTRRDRWLVVGTQKVNSTLNGLDKLKLLV